MNGTITFTSELGRGSEFVVSVPVELPKEEMGNSVGDECPPFANLTPPSSSSGSASISPTSSASGSPPSSPPHTPTGFSPNGRHLRPHSLLSPISFSHMMAANNANSNRIRSPSSPASRPGNPLSPLIPHSPPTSVAPGSPIPPAPSPPTLYFDSPFCSPTGSPGVSPPRSPTEHQFSNLRTMHSISPIAHIQPEHTSPTNSIFQSFNTCPPFLLDIRGKALTSHLCPSDRPCPRCAFTRPAAPPQSSAAPHSDPVSPRRMFAAAHRMHSRFVSPAQYSSPTIPHNVNNTNNNNNNNTTPSHTTSGTSPTRAHYRSTSDSCTATLIAQLNLSSSIMRSSMGSLPPHSPATTTLHSSLGSPMYPSAPQSLSCSKCLPIPEEAVEEDRNGKQKNKTTDIVDAELQVTASPPPSSSSSSSSHDQLHDDIIICPPLSESSPPPPLPTSPQEPHIEISPVQEQLTPLLPQQEQELTTTTTATTTNFNININTNTPSFLRETQALIPILTPTITPPTTPTLFPLTPTITPLPVFEPISLPSSPTLPDSTSQHYYPPSPDMNLSPPAIRPRPRPRIPRLELTRSASSTTISSPLGESNPLATITSTTSTTTFLSTATPEIVPRVPSLQSSTESSPALASVLLSPPSFLRKLDELLGAVASSSSAPTTPTKHSTPPPTPTRHRAASISILPRTPKTPKTPKIPRTPPLATSGPLAILANLFTPQSSPAKSKVSLARSASFSTPSPSSLSRSSTVSPVSSPANPSPREVSSNPETPHFYAPLVSPQTPSVTTKAAQALSRVTSLPSLSKSYSHIRPQSPSSSGGSNSPLSPVLSFVPSARASSSPSLSSVFGPSMASSSPPGIGNSSSPPASPTKFKPHGLVGVPESPIHISPRHHPLHSSLGTLLIPSPSSSLPTPDPPRKLYVSGPIDIANPAPSPYSPNRFSPSVSPSMSPAMSPAMSPVMSPTISPYMSPSISPFSPRMCARENPSEISPSSSGSPLPFLCTTPIPNSPMSLASSPTSISSSPNSSSSCLSGPSSLSSSLSSSPSSPSPMFTSPAAMFASSSPPITSTPTTSPPSPSQSPSHHHHSSLSSSPSSTLSSSSALPTGLHILVVEDNNLNQNIIKKMLERVGWDVTVASNGREALDILFKQDNEKYVGYSKFSIILMDCQMPVLDGYQATRRIRKRERSNSGQHIRIVAITASSHAEDERKCYEAGMDGFIAKPISPQTLYNTIAAQSSSSPPSS